MSTRSVGLVKIIVLTGVIALTVTGCTYDYLQHTDKVGYSAGDAVKANLESETINPSRRSTYTTTGLGKDGNVIPNPTGASQAP